MQGAGAVFPAGGLEGFAACPSLHPSRFFLERFAVRNVQLLLRRRSLEIGYEAAVKQLSLSHSVPIVLGTLLFPVMPFSREWVMDLLDIWAESHGPREEFMEQDLTRFHVLDKVNPIMHLTCIISASIMLLEAVVGRLVAVDVLLGKWMFGWGVVTAFSGEVETWLMRMCRAAVLRVVEVGGRNVGRGIRRLCDVRRVPGGDNV